MTAFAYAHPWIGMAGLGVVVIGMVVFVALLSSGGRDG